MGRMKKQVNLDSISIVLVRPKFHENVGSVARTMKNMGFHRLLIVQGCSPLHMKAYRLASGAEEILERAEEFFTLREALARNGLCGRYDLARKEGEQPSPHSQSPCQETRVHFGEEPRRPRLWPGTRGVDE